MKMSIGLDTLLEAARYIELQELQQQKLEAENGGGNKKISNGNGGGDVSSSSQQALHLQIGAPSPGSSKSPPPASYHKQDSQSQRSSPVSSTNHPQRVFHNSFDIINPLVIDEGGEQKRKQPPIVFRAGTREVHNKLEKHRRAHLKECFEGLKKQLPATPDEKKTSNLSILHSALRFIQTLKRKERELEHEMERLAREKIAHQQKLAVLKKEVASQCDVDFSTLMPDVSSASPSRDVSSEPSVLPQSPPEGRLQEVTVSGVPGIPVSTGISISGVPSSAAPGLNVPEQRVVRPAVPRPVAPATASVNGLKENQGNQVQTAALSVLPVGYPVSQGLVLQKVALVSKGITELSPLVSTPVAHFIATPQQIGGKMVPLVNAQYVVKPAVVVVSTPSRPS